MMLKEESNLFKAVGDILEIRQRPWRRSRSQRHACIADTFGCFQKTKAPKIRSCW